MIYLALIVLLVTGCASSTAAISQAASSTREAVLAAQVHLAEANKELQQIALNCQRINDSIPYVSDDVPAIYSTLQYVSIAVVAAVIGALIYTYIPRGR
jgi:hypothetical protein